MQLREHTNQGLTFAQSIFYAVMKILDLLVKLTGVLKHSKCYQFMSRFKWFCKSHIENCILEQNFHEMVSRPNKQNYSC